MAQTKYTFSIADDTANGIVASGSLESDIYDSPIIVALDYINTEGDVLDIYFKDELISACSSHLTTLVEAHDGVQPVEFAQWEYKTLVDPTAEDLNAEGAEGWEVYEVEGTSYQMKRVV